MKTAPYLLVLVVLLGSTSTHAADAPAQTPTQAPPTEPKPPGSSDPLVNPRPGFFANVAVDHADGNYQEGEKIAVRFQVERDAYVYLLYHQFDDTTWLVFPNKARPANQLKAKEQVAIPAPGEAFRFRVRAPFGEEAIQLIASTKPIAEFDALDVTSGKSPQVSTELLLNVKDRIDAAPEEFGEHRVRIHTVARSEPVQPPQPPRKSGRVALCIGVNKYRDPKSCSEHEETRRAAEHMAKAFRERCGVDSEKVRVLSGTDTTYDKIEEAVTRWLPSVSQPGDTVFLFYCGHGNQVPSRDPRRVNGMESYLTVHDNDQKMILETTLARWLQELPGRQIVLLLEACRSGGFAASKGTSPRRPFMQDFFVDEADRLKGISRLNTIIISACGSDENDRFRSGPDEVCCMAAFLTEAMAKLPAPVTVEQAFVYYKTRLRTWLEQELGEQEPVMLDNVLLPVEFVQNSNSK